MTVHNGARYVAEAVQSVLAQRFGSLELLVVDDASTDGTLNVLRALRDERLRVLPLRRNVGPFAAANLGLSHARGELIARMDADDVSEPERLETQVAFLARRPHVGLVGSACTLLTPDGEISGTQAVPLTEEAIRARALLSPPFVHSTVIWRRSLGLRYDASYRVAGDYELWTRALARTRAANLPEPLVRYRVWTGGITGQRGLLQRALHDAIAHAYLRQLWPSSGISLEDHVRLRRWAARAERGAPISADAAAVLHRLTALLERPAANRLARRTVRAAMHRPLAELGQPLSHGA